jgi:uncharacterized protein (TIGR03118 family)
MKTLRNHLTCSLRQAAGLGAVLICLILTEPAGAQGYEPTLLVSDVAGGAANTDTNLVNAWGLEITGNGTLIVCATETSLAGFYHPDGAPTGQYITVDEEPTGIEINPFGNSFKIGTDHRKASQLLFATEEGTIMGWNSRVNATEAVVAVDNSASGAIYKGMTVANSRRGPRLYATNFHGGTVDVFDKKFQPVGSFTDSTVDAGFAPFNILSVDDVLVVTFAKQEGPDAEDDEPGAGNGFVDIFNTEGRLLRRFASHGPLNSPWGLALAPKHFGEFSKTLLIGNFGDGRINAFNPRTGAFLGPLSDSTGAALEIDGLWALKFAKVKHNSHGHGDDDDDYDGPALYFTAGPGDEAHGLVGRITPEP